MTERRELHFGTASRIVEPPISMKQTADGSNLPREASQLPPLDLRLLALIAAVKLLLHRATAGRYGYFRDELYFLDLRRHLGWAHVDFAPMVALYAELAL